MGKIDIDKFVGSLIARSMISRGPVSAWLKGALEDQGLEYRDGRVAMMPAAPAEPAKAPFVPPSEYGGGLGFWSPGEIEDLIRETNEGSKKLRSSLCDILFANAHSQEELARRYAAANGGLDAGSPEVKAYRQGLADMYYELTRLKLK